MTALLEHEAMPADVLTPFDVPGGPPAGLTLNTPITLTLGDASLAITLTPTHVEQAYLHLVGHYQAQPGVDHTPTISRAKKARAALLTRPWRVAAPAEVYGDAAELEPGTVLLLPGSGAHTYAVDDRDCRLQGVRARKGGPAYCPDSIFATTRKRDRAKRAAGEMLPVACYHTIARELLRLATAFAAIEAHARTAPRSLSRAPSRPSDTLDTDCALVTIPAYDLWAACFLARRAGGEVTIRATAGDLQLAVGKCRTVLDATGDGVASVVIRADDFARYLWEPLSERIKVLAETPIEVIIDLTGDEPLVGFNAEDFGAMGPARRSPR